MTAVAPLFLVVGPSGVGKDTLLSGARAALAGDPGFLFARRVITRPAEAGGEEHEPASPEAFERAEASGAFMLSWRAHGLAYGIPTGLSAERARGVAVVANVSRAVIGDARARLAPVRVIAIEAGPALLAARLAARGREDATDIARRLERAAAPLRESPDMTRLVNDGTVEAGVAALVRLLRDR